MFCSVPLSAQQEKTAGQLAASKTIPAWTMEQCIDYAVTHAVEVRRGEVEVRKRKGDYRYAVLDFLPSVSASAAGQYAWGRNIDPETNTYNNVTTFNNYYQLYASLPVFDGGYTINAFRQARLAKNNSESAMAAIKEDKAIDVMSKFVDALYAERTIQLAETKLKDSKALLEKTEKLFALGEKSRPDVVQMQSQVAEDDYNLLHQRNLARQTLMVLKSAMCYPAGDSLSIVEKSEKRKEKKEKLADATSNSKLLSPNGEQEDNLLFSLPSSLSSFNSPHVQNAEYAAESARLNWKMQRAQLLPTLSLNVGVSTSYYKNLSQKGEVASFSSQFHNNMGEYAYLSLSIPLFAVSKMKSAHAAKAAYQTALLDLEETKRKQSDDMLQAVLDRNGYEKEVLQMEKKVQSDSLAYYLSRRKYEEGMLSTFDLHTASETLLESQTKLLQMRMMLTLKNKLVNYYKGISLWTSK